MLSAERDGLITELNAYLRNTQSIIEPLSDSIALTSMNIKFNELLSHPVLALSDALIAQRQAYIKTEKNKLIPDFNLGYSNLSIIGWQTPDGLTQKYYGAGSRFGIYQFGMGLPIFSGATKARINAAKIGLEIATLDRDLRIDQLNTQYIRLFNTYKKQKEIFNYYEKVGLNISDEMIKQAGVRFKNGDIAFAEWALLVNQSLQIKIAHADIIKSLQYSMAELKYLTEKK